MLLIMHYLSNTDIASPRVDIGKIKIMGVAVGNFVVM
jgi:hypothetical protein